MNMQHQDIKTQPFSETSFHSWGFSLQSMENHYRSTDGRPDSPHRHDFYTILFIEQGEGTHIVDFKEYKVENNTIYFIQPGQMHQVILTGKPKGWIITFTEEFLITNSIPEKLINDIYLFNDYGQSPPLPINEKDILVYLNLIAQMEHFTASLESYSMEAAGSLVKLFLIQSNNHCSLHKSNNPQLVETSNHILRNFKKLLSKQYADAHKVSDYADELAVTGDYLNKTVKSITGKSAKDHIQSKLIIEAKRALLFSELSNKELAYNLGFEESAHFNNFFKKSTGLTPTEFRVLARQS
jgi:AraC-like DNA-binding protein